MTYLLNDEDVALLIAMYDPDDEYYLDSMDPYTISDKKELIHKSNPFPIDLTGLILNYMKSFLKCTRNQVLIDACDKNDIKAFYDELKVSEEDRYKYRSYVSENLIPMFEFFGKQPYFDVTDRFIKNYLDGSITRDSFIMHLLAIDRYLHEEYFSIKFTYDFSPERVHDILDDLYESKEYGPFVILANASINGDAVGYESYKGKLAVAEFKLNEAALLQEKNENSVKYHLVIIGEHTAIKERIKTKLGKYIFDNIKCDEIPFEDPFIVYLTFPNPTNYQKCLKFLQDQKSFFDELRAFQHGLLDITLVETVTYYPQHRLESESIDDELLKLGIKYRIDYRLGE